MTLSTLGSTNRSPQLYVVCLTKFMWSSRQSIFFPQTELLYDCDMYDMENRRTNKFCDSSTFFKDCRYIRVSHRWFAYTLGSKNRRPTILEPNITNSMTQQLLITIPRFSPFPFTMILMISDMEIDSNTLGSTNRRPNFCMIEICSTCKSDDMVNRKINKFGVCRAFGSWVCWDRKLPSVSSIDVFFLPPLSPCQNVPDPEAMSPRKWLT